MSGELIPPNNTDRDIFNSHFSRLLEPDDFARAQAIFDAVGRFNERSIAMQIDLGFQSGKLEEVLAAYEILTAEDSWLHNVPDFITAAAEVREFGDVIYATVISDGEINTLLAMREEFPAPKIFDLMGQDASGFKVS